jgi:hypothetical protein
MGRVEGSHAVQLENKFACLVAGTNSEFEWASSHKHAAEVKIAVAALQHYNIPVVLELQPTAANASPI